MRVVWSRAFEEVVGEGDTPTGFVGGVVGFGEDEDVRLVGGGKVFNIHDGGVETAGVEGDEVQRLGCVVGEDGGGGGGGGVGVVGGRAFDGWRWGGGGRKRRGGGDERGGWGQGWGGQGGGVEGVEKVVAALWEGGGAEGVVP